MTIIRENHRINNYHEFAFIEYGGEIELERELAER